MFFGVVHIKLSAEASFRWTHTRPHHGNKQPLHCFKSPLNVFGCWLTAWTQTSITIAISSSPCLYPLEVPLPTFLNYFGWLLTSFFLASGCCLAFALGVGHFCSINLFCLRRWPWGRVVRCRLMWKQFLLVGGRHKPDPFQPTPFK